jgi:hypothetical protein
MDQMQVVSDLLQYFNFTHELLSNIHKKLMFYSANLTWRIAGNCTVILASVAWLFADINSPHNCINLREKVEHGNDCANGYHNDLKNIHASSSSAGMMVGASRNQLTIARSLGAR